MPGASLTARLSDLVTVNTSGDAAYLIETYYHLTGYLQFGRLTEGERIILEAERARCFAELRCREHDFDLRPRPSSSERSERGGLVIRVARFVEQESAEADGAR